MPNLLNAQITLRPEGPEDEGFLYHVYASTRAEEMALAPWNACKKEAFLRIQFELQRIHYRRHYPDAEFQIILSTGRPVGRLYIHRGEDETRIVDIALLPECRGAGIGGFLVANELVQAAKAGKRVTLHVERSNPARRLYERLGFRLVEDKGIYLFLEWKFGGVPASGLAPREDSAS